MSQPRERAGLPFRHFSGRAGAPVVESIERRLLLSSAVNLAISPDTGVSSSDAITATGDLILRGDLVGGVSGVTVFDETLGRDLRSAQIDGGSFSKALYLDPGPHRLRVTVTDLAGAASDAWLDVLVDQTAPDVVEMSLHYAAGPDVDGFDVTFDEAVNAAWLIQGGGIASAVTLRRDDQPVSLDAGGFSYEAATCTLSYRHPGGGALPAGEYELALDRLAFTDLAGNTLGVIGDGPYFAQPVFLQAAGGDLQVARYSAPAIGDWNGDGLADLLVGEQLTTGQGVLRVYLNVGTADAPAYDMPFNAPAAGQDISLPAGGCQGLTARLGDLTGDGRDDLVVGLSDGSVLWYPNISEDGGVLLDAGRPLEVGPAGAKVPVKVLARAAVDLVDWNGDGRLDVLVGDYVGNVHLLLNEAAEGVDLVADTLLQAGSAALTVPLYRAAPTTADVDGDGRRDLVAGNTAGQLWLYRNAGTDAAPVLAAGEPVTVEQVPVDLAGDPRSRPFAADWDGDGLVDLLVGSLDGLVRLYRQRPEPTYTMAFTVAARPTVAGTQIGDGGQQRSFVDRLTVSFDRPVTLSPGAIELRLAGGALIGATVSALPGGYDHLVTFAPLADGRYTLSVIGEAVASPAGAMAGVFSQGFHRLAGDADGDASVNFGDFLIFASAWGGEAGDGIYTLGADLDADGVVGFGDFIAFCQQFGKTV